MLTGLPNEVLQEVENDGEESGDGAANTTTTIIPAPTTAPETTHSMWAHDCIETHHRHSMNL